MDFSQSHLEHVNISEDYYDEVFLAELEHFELDGGALPSRTGRPTWIGKNWIR